MTANTSMTRYQHTQRGTFILATTLGLAAVFAGVGLVASQLKQIWIGAGILLVCSWLFSSLTVKITEHDLCWKFGPGLIRKRVPLTDIVSTLLVKTNFLEGWGIHWSPRLGWLYNVSGFDAVVVTLRSGKKFALGTDDPQALIARLAEVTRQNPPVGFKT